MIASLYRLLKSAVIVLLTVYVAVVGYLYVNQDRLLFPIPDGAPVSVPSGIEAITLTVTGGLQLNSFFADAGESAPAILFFHGNGSTADRGFERAARYREAGYSVLLAEYRGYGRSDGQPSADALKRDGLESFDWLAARSKSPVFVVGHSLGSGIAVHVAANRPVSGLFLEAPYSSIADVAQARYPFVPVGPLLTNPISPVDEIGGLSMPVMIVHGTLDQTIPIRFGKALYDAAPKGSVWKVLDGAGHNDLANHGIHAMATGFFSAIPLIPLDR